MRMLCVCIERLPILMSYRVLFTVIDDDNVTDFSFETLMQIEGLRNVHVMFVDVYGMAMANGEYNRAPEATLLSNLPLSFLPEEICQIESEYYCDGVTCQTM